MSLPQRVKQYMLSHNMMQTESGILIGLSGGADSVCLLCVLKELAEELSLSLEAMHIHHGIRGAEADSDAEFCRQLCEYLQVPYQVRYVDVPKEAKVQKCSLEEAGRTARYRELEARRQQMGADARIAVAHHREDQAETVLWNLLRGSGLKGLAGMEPVRHGVIRPLLEVSKEEILEYLQQKEMLWQQDSTNDSDAYTRNRIRHYILEYAQKELNTQAAEHICQAALVAGQAHQYLQRQAKAWLEQYGGEDSLPAAGLAKEDPILQQYVLREFVGQKGSLTDLSARHCKAMQDLLTEEKGGSAHRQIHLPGGMVARRSYERLLLEKEEKPEQEGGGEGANVSETRTAEAYPVVTIDTATLDQTLKNGEKNPIYIHWGEECFEFCLFSYEKTQKFPVKQCTKWMNYDKLKEALVIRTRRTGDYFLLPDGGRKTVKSYMIDEKIPADQRDRIPVVAQGSHVLWIPGYRLSEGAKVSDETTMILEITKCGG